METIVWFKTLILFFSIINSTHACFVDVSKETHGWVSGSKNVMSETDQIYFLNLKNKNLQEVGPSIVLLSNDDTFVFTFNSTDKKDLFKQFVVVEKEKCSKD